MPEGLRGKFWRVQAPSFSRRYAKESKIDASFIFRFRVARLRKGFHPREWRNMSIHSPLKYRSSERNSRFLAVPAGNRKRISPRRKREVKIKSPYERAGTREDHKRLQKPPPEISWNLRLAKTILAQGYLRMFHPEMKRRRIKTKDPLESWRSGKARARAFDPISLIETEGSIGSESD